MIRFFIKVLIVFVVLFFAIKWVTEEILFQNVYSDRNRVIAGLYQVHLDQLDFLAYELVACDPQSQATKLAEFQKKSIVPIDIRANTELSESDRERLSKPDGFIYRYSDGMIDYLGVRLDNQHHLLFGPMGDLANRFIEDQVDSWLKVVREALESSRDSQGTLSTYSSQFRVPIRIEQRQSLPDRVSEKMKVHHDSIFYQSSDESFVALELGDSSQVLCMGPLTKVTDYAQVALKKGFLVCLLASSAILGWMIFRVSSRFRKIEKAAVEIADGNFSARVNTPNLGEAKKLALAFNTMASKTESVIRTQKELLQVVSHELRTPLARLKFAAALLHKANASQENDSPMPVMLQSIDDIETIVQEVFFYIKNEQADPLKNKELITIDLALEGVLRTLRIEYPQLRIEMVFADRDSSKKVLADRRSFQRAFGNLTSNGARYAKSLLRLRVSEVQESVSGGGELSYICIDIEDDGPGIPDAMRSEVMKPFVRIDPEAQNQQQASSHSGLGLGLAIVQRILQQHGGSVEIDRGALGGCLVRTRWPTT
jgi:two-component system sensor histidine kinase RstB